MRNRIKNKNNNHATQQQQTRQATVRTDDNMIELFWDLGTGEKIKILQLRDHRRR